MLALTAKLVPYIRGLTDQTPVVGFVQFGIESPECRMRADHSLDGGLRFGAIDAGGNTRTRAGARCQRRRDQKRKKFHDDINSRMSVRG
jgi:hypothetical protein